MQDRVPARSLGNRRCRNCVWCKTSASPSQALLPADPSLIPQGEHSTPTRMQYGFLVASWASRTGLLTDSTVRLCLCDWIGSRDKRTSTSLDVDIIALWKQTRHRMP